MVRKLVKKIVTKFAVAKKAARMEGMAYQSPGSYFPTRLLVDSSFPFREGASFPVRLAGRKPLVHRRPRTTGISPRLRRASRITSKTSLHQHQSSKQSQALQWPRQSSSRKA